MKFIGLKETVKENISTNSTDLFSDKLKIRLNSDENISSYSW